MRRTHPQLCSLAIPPATLRRSPILRAITRQRPRSLYNKIAHHGGCYNFRTSEPFDSRVVSRDFDGGGYRVIDIARAEAERFSIVVHAQPTSGGSGEVA